MIKFVRICFSIMFVLGLLSIGTPLTVEAKPGTSGTENTSNARGSWTGLATGSWTGGVDVDVRKAALTAPTWLQLTTTNGVKVTTPGKICHPFRGGQFGWVGEIHQLLDNGNWKRLKTVNDWVPSKEGTFMACAEAPKAGIYALFATLHAVGSVEESVFSCSSIDWVGVSASFDTNLIVEGTIPSLPNTVITITVHSSSGGSYAVSGIDTVTTDGFGHFRLDSTVITDSIPDPSTSFVISYAEALHGCSSPLITK